jgi:hypothetical protein
MKLSVLEILNKKMSLFKKKENKKVNRSWLGVSTSQRRRIKGKDVGG